MTVHFIGAGPGAPDLRERSALEVASVLPSVGRDAAFTARASLRLEFLLDQNIVDVLPFENSETSRLAERVGEQVGDTCSERPAVRWTCAILERDDGDRRLLELVVVAVARKGAARRRHASEDEDRREGENSRRAHVVHSRGFPLYRQQRACP